MSAANYRPATRAQLEQLVIWHRLRQERRRPPDGHECRLQLFVSKYRRLSR